MNVAVLSLTRDRLDYTRHCFTSLTENAGCDFDWWITDQASTDGTPEWLVENTDATVFMLDENIGISRALNMMLDDALTAADYDVVVKVDNDCELRTPDTLNAVCEATLEWGMLLSPHIRGLRDTPPTLKQIGPVAVKPVIGGIFMAAPAAIFKNGYRHNPGNPLWAGDDYNLCAWWQRKGGHVGYLDGYEAWHYETTDGQHERYPDYFARRAAEGCR